MNVVDSSEWLEYFAGGPNAPSFAKPIEATAELVVPTLSLYEVFKKIAQQRGEGDALRDSGDRTGCECRVMDARCRLRDGTVCSVRGEEVRRPVLSGRGNPLRHHALTG